MKFNEVVERKQGTRRLNNPICPNPIADSGTRHIEVPGGIRVGVSGEVARVSLDGLFQHLPSVPRPAPIRFVNPNT